MMNNKFIFLLNEGLDDTAIASFVIRGLRTNKIRSDFEFCVLYVATSEICTNVTKFQLRS